MINASNLRIEIAADRGTSSDVSLHDIANNFDCFDVLETSRILIRLVDDNVPL